MRIDGWDIRAFGPLRGWSVEEVGAHEIIVILGDNETGKSALFEFFTTALFGFMPAAAETHPYTPLEGGFPDGSLSGTLADGASVRVARRLTSRPEGSLTVDGNLTNISNRPVSWVGSLTRQMFTNTHALTQEEALGFKQAAWAEVQERILGGASYEFLLPARVAVERLHEKANRYWRSDRRGKPLDREIRARIRESRRELEPAQQRRDAILKIDSRLVEIAGLLEELETAPDGVHAIDLAIERADTIYPVVRSLEGIRDLERQAQELLPHDDLPDDPRALLAAHRRELESHAGAVEELESDIEKRDAAVELDNVTLRLIEHRREVELLHGEISLHREDLDRVARMDRGLQATEGRIAELGGRLLDGPPDRSARELLRNLPTAELPGRIETWQEAHAHLETAARELESAELAHGRLRRRLNELPESGDGAAVEERLRRLRTLPAEETAIARMRGVTGATRRWAPHPALSAAVAIAGIAAFVVGLIVGDAIGTALVALGVLLAVLGAVPLLMRLGAAATPAGTVRDGERVVAELRSQMGLEPKAQADEAIRAAEAQLEAARTRRDLEARVEEARSDAEEARDRREPASAGHAEARESVLGILADLPVAAVRLERPGSTLLPDFEALRAAVTEVHETGEDRAEVAQHIAQRTERVRALAEALDAPLPDDPVEAILDAHEGLADAVRRHQAAQEAEAELPSLRERLEAEIETRDGVRLRLDQLTERLAAVDRVNSDPDRGLELVEEARSARQRARQRREELAREVPDWESKGAEGERLIAAGVRLELASEERTELRRRREAIDGQIGELQAERGRSGLERENLLAEPGPAHFEGAIQAAEAELEDAHRAHDRIALLAAVIREAEQQYRERFQTPLLKTATLHLKRITAGRYDLLTVDDTDPDGARLIVRQRGQDFPVRVEHPLSRGTLQQIYLALRLAMADQVVENGEPLPLFLDEMFVNWDPRRTARGVEILGALGQNRQVFLFTADPRWAQTAAELVQAHILTTPALAS